MRHAIEALFTVVANAAHAVLLWIMPTDQE